MPRYIRVTGGAGFIGSHICKALSRAGMIPVTYDNLSTGHADSVRSEERRVGKECRSRWSPYH